MGWNSPMNFFCSETTESNMQIKKQERNKTSILFPQKLSQKPQGRVLGIGFIGL
jgi:hypothetical protein